MREAVDHLAAIRAMMEAAAQAPPANQTDTAPLIDQTDLLTLQQAAGLAHRNESTIRRWQRQFDIGTTICSTPWIFKSKLLAHLAHVAKRGSE
jgi:hypothetical protein